MDENLSFVLLLSETGALKNARKGRAVNTTLFGRAEMCFCSQKGKFQSKFESEDG